MNYAEQVADTMPPPPPDAVTWDAWQAVTSHGRAWQDLSEAEREDIRVLYGDIGDDILRHQKWRRR